MILAWKTPQKPHINWENAINILKRPKHQKTHQNITDALDGDAKIDDDDDAADAPNNSDNDDGSADSKNSHIHWETSIMPLMLMIMMLTPPMMLPPPTLS